LLYPAYRVIYLKEEVIQVIACNSGVATSAVERLEKIKKPASPR